MPAQRIAAVDDVLPWNAFELELEMAAVQCKARGDPLAVTVLKFEPGAGARAQTDPVGRTLALAVGEAGTVACLGDDVFAVMFTSADLPTVRELADYLLEGVRLHVTCGDLRGRVCAGAAASPDGRSWGGGEVLDLAHWRCLLGARRGDRHPVCSGHGGAAGEGWPELAL